ncbi:endopygalactorunase [Pseudoflavitalea sp. G-6-1-2]|nr:endopygalactorunase [Pseudoflavitalea sp. G-6-1-2]
MQVAAIFRDTIILTSGSTYEFSVDTKEGEGLISTVPDLNGVTDQLKFPERSIISFESANGDPKTSGAITDGDRLVLESGKITKKYYLSLKPLAKNGKLTILQPRIMAGTSTDIRLGFTAGQRSPNATVRFLIPPGLEAGMDNIKVNVIGRGEVLLRDLATQSIGRTGSKYGYSKVGTAELEAVHNGTLLTLRGLDLRPSNGEDVVLTIKRSSPAKIGQYEFSCSYSTSAPAILNSFGGSTERVTQTVTLNIEDFGKAPHKTGEAPEASLPGKDEILAVTFSPSVLADKLKIQQSTDQGRTWKDSKAVIDAKQGSGKIDGLQIGQYYQFRISASIRNKISYSNIFRYYHGPIPATAFGITGDSTQDYTARINAAIDSIHRMGGGTLYFGKGMYRVRTVLLKSNVHLYVSKEATIAALKGGNAPELTWFSDRKYRSGLSPTDAGPYEDPENYLTKQDVGHHYFRNAMFFAERENNIAITGNGRITGNGNLVTGDKVMNNAPGNRSDKMFTFKLCTNIRIGGLARNEDLWYDENKDAPYYILPNNQRDYAVDNMLHIDQGGHFVLLATGTDGITVHDTYFGKANPRNARDIYDFMACNNVDVKNIYSKVSSDDIVKPGSDCSLGFTRPASKYKVRNVIGDTNCNLFQVGSETADDIKDICVDNIFVLGANKAGFSISTNDGAHISNIHLNCGHTGAIHSRSKMRRTFTPFFISISNRARILGAEVGRYSFTENGEQHNELLVKNVNIGQVDNIILNGIDITEVYAGSSFSAPDNRWKAYDGKQRRATPIVAGYSLPESAVVQGGLDFTLPNGKHTGYISNIQFNDVQVLVKGSNSLSDTAALCPELGVGQYNASNLKTQPAYGLWARHAADLTINNCGFNVEQADGRYAIFLDDVKGATITGNKMVKAAGNASVIKLKLASSVTIDQNIYFDTQWNNKPLSLSGIQQAQPAVTGFPLQTGQ